MEIPVGSRMKAGVMNPKYAQHFVRALIVFRQSTLSSRNGAGYGHRMTLRLSVLRPHKAIAFEF
jgi:hypothetical protein